MKDSFYYGGSFNVGENKGAGSEIARKVIPKLMDATGSACTSRWPWSAAHETQEQRRTIAVTDLLDVARSDYCVFAPVTSTSRGMHVEMGLALALDKPSFLYRPRDLEGTGFDILFKPFPPRWAGIVDDVLMEVLGP